MFKGVVALGADADGLIRDYLAFQRGRLASFVGAWNGPRMVAELRNLRDDVAGFKTRADALLAAPDSHLLTPDQIHNLNVISTEVATAIEEIDEEAEPDKKWGAMNERQKKDATQSVPVDRDQLIAVAARLNGHRAGEPARKRDANGPKK